MSSRMASDGSFHEAALKGVVDEFKKLATLGMDPNTPNSAGRLPLHTFCSAPWMPDEFPLGVEVPRPAAEWLIQHTKDINTPDQDGITALHIASMMSQYLVKKLVVAGADPTHETCDGMGALHLAARARQSNIVGMLTEALANQDEKSQEGHVNAKDGIARTPLHYACRSGRPETVSYLIAAGADPTSLDGDGLTPLDACLEFEEEQALWADHCEPELPEWYWLHHTYLPSDWDSDPLGGIRRQDGDRPWIRPSRELQYAMNRLDGLPWPDPLCICSVQHTVRLGEVLDLIIKALKDRGEGAEAVQDHIGKCIKHCEVRGMNYTRSCLLDLQARINTDSTLSAITDRNVYECIQRGQFDLQERVGKRYDQPSDRVHLALVHVLLRRREYNVLECILRQDSAFLPLHEPDVCNIARLLASNGFAKLLETLIHSKYGDQIRSEINGPSTSADPLLIVAVKRQLPNMDVVHLLVEEAQMDINCISRTGEEAYEDVDGPGILYDFDIRQPGLNTALHECAKGYNWWQAKYCLPYLLSHGADTQLKNESGHTAYDITQADYKETFMDDTTRLLKLTSNAS
jgi:hypothetical protein